METLDFIEDQSRRNAAFSLESMELMSKRAHAMVTMLLGGAVATGGFALNLIGKPGALWSLGGLAAVSLWWFAVAAWAVLMALRTRETRAPANSGQALLTYLDGPLAAYALENGGDDFDKLAALRRGELMTLEATVHGYRTNTNAVAWSLDAAYVATACTPLLAMVGAGLSAWLA
jgi:hypothetical protein